MDNRSEVRAFLTSRRAKVTPEQAGIPAYGSRRVLDSMTGVPAFLRNHRFDLAGDGLALLATWSATREDVTARADD